MVGPLSSLKVLDFTALLPGPFATMMLADLGADVVRVESPHRPDLVRHKAPFLDGTSAWHGVLGRSKRTLALDLKKPGATAIVKRLATTYDIVVEQFRPGVMDRLGVGYEALRAENPRLIYCALSGYGQTGPLRDRAGHDINYLALSGVASYGGRAGEGPSPFALQVADVGAGSLGTVLGILAAVVHRQQTGEGQFVDVSMFDGMLAWNSLAAADALAGVEPAPETTLLNGGTYYDYYRTRDGRYLAVGGLEPKFWRGFCEAIGRPDLVMKGVSEAPGSQAVLKEEIAKEIATRDFATWVEQFATLDVCVEPVLSVREALAHPQTRARAMLVDVPTGSGQQQTQVAHPLKFSRTAPSYRHTGAAPGAHTATVLREAGYSVETIREMERAGLFGDTLQMASAMEEGDSDA